MVLTTFINPSTLALYNMATNKGIINALTRIMEKLEVITNWGSNGKGVYAAGTQYQKGDLVSYNGLAYVAIIATLGNLPTNTTYWQQITVAGPAGTMGPPGPPGANGSAGATGPQGPIGASGGSIQYAEDAGASDAYAITVSGVSAYNTGDMYAFKANTVNTGAATLNVNSLGAKTIKKNYNADLADGDIKAGQRVHVIYDGTNFQMLSQLGNASAGGGSIPYAEDAGASDAYAITAGSAVAYANGDMYAFKANTTNTGAATLNVNGLGAKTIKKNKDQDLHDGEIKAGQIVIVQYDGTNFQMQSQSGRVYPRGGTQNIATNQNTTSTSFTDLTTVGPSATVIVGESGMVLVTISALIYSAGTILDAYMGIDVSGANTEAASKAKSISNKSGNGIGVGMALLYTGLNQGSTTFKAKYAVEPGGCTGNFVNRNLSAVAL